MDLLRTRTGKRGLFAGALCAAGGFSSGSVPVSASVPHAEAGAGSADLMARHFEQTLRLRDQHELLPQGVIVEIEPLRVGGPISLLGYGHAGAAAAARMVRSPLWRPMKSEVADERPRGQNIHARALQARTDPVRLLICDGQDALALAAAERAAWQVGRSAPGATILLTTGNSETAALLDALPWASGLSRLIIPSSPLGAAAALKATSELLLAGLFTRISYVAPPDAGWLLGCGPRDGGIGIAMPLAQSGGRHAATSDVAKCMTETLLALSGPREGGWRLSCVGGIGSGYGFGHLERWIASVAASARFPVTETIPLGVTSQPGDQIAPGPSLLLLTTGGGGLGEIFDWWSDPRSSREPT